MGIGDLCFDLQLFELGVVLLTCSSFLNYRPAHSQQ